MDPDQIDSCIVETLERLLRESGFAETDLADDLDFEWGSLAPPPADDEDQAGEMAWESDLEVTPDTLD